MAFDSMRGVSLPYSRNSRIIHVLTANKPRKASSLLHLQHCLPFRSTCQSSGHRPPCPGGGLGEDREHASSGPAVSRSPAGRSGSLPPHLFSSHIHPHPFSPCQVPGPTSIPSPLSMGWLSLNERFIPRTDGCLGTAAPVTHWIERRVHLI